VPRIEPEVSGLPQIIAQRVIEASSGIDELSPETEVPADIPVLFTQIFLPLIREDGEPFAVRIEPGIGIQFNSSHIFRPVEQLDETLFDIFGVIKE